MKLSLTVTDWCDIFADQATLSPNVFWVRSIDYNQQVFLSTAFTSIWGVSQDVLYNRPDAFGEFIISDNKDELAIQYEARHHQQTTGVALYKIKSATGEGKYIRDRYMTLCDASGKPFAAAGIAMDITKKLHESPDLHEQVYKTCSNILQEKLEILTNYQAPKPIELTLREKQCARFIKQGFTAAQTAEALCISRRTVEKHIETLRYKFNCPTKLDLLRLLIEEQHHINLA